MKTVREFLENIDCNGVHMMTPGGYVDLTKEQVKDLLNGKDVRSHLGFSDTNMMTSAEEVLSQVIATDIQYNKDGSVGFLTAVA